MPDSSDPLRLLSEHLENRSLILDQYQSLLRVVPEPDEAQRAQRLFNEALVELAKELRGQPLGQSQFVSSLRVVMQRLLRAERPRVGQREGAQAALRPMREMTMESPAALMLAVATTGLSLPPCSLEPELLVIEALTRLRSASDPDRLVSARQFLIELVATARTVAGAIDGPPTESTSDAYLELLIAPGDASADDLQRLLTALNEYHLASGGLGFAFQIDGTLIRATEGVHV